MRQELSKADKELYMQILRIGRNSLQGITVDHIVMELIESGFKEVSKHSIVLQYALRVAFIRSDTGQPATNGYPNIIWLRLEAMAFLQTEDSLAETKQAVELAEKSYKITAYAFWASVAAIAVSIISLFWSK